MFCIGNRKFNKGFILCEVARFFSLSRDFMRHQISNLLSFGKCVQRSTFCAVTRSSLNKYGGHSALLRGSTGKNGTEAKDTWMGPYDHAEHRNSFKIFKFGRSDHIFGKNRAEKSHFCHFTLVIGFLAPILPRGK